MDSKKIIEQVRAKKEKSKLIPKHIVIAEDFNIELMKILKEQKLKFNPLVVELLKAFVKDHKEKKKK